MGKLNSFALLIRLSIVLFFSIRVCWTQYSGSYNSFAVVRQLERYQPMSEERWNFLNSLNLPWKAGRNFEAQPDIDIEALRVMLGSKHAERRDEYKKIMKKLDDYVDDVRMTTTSIPISFDARNRWPGCIGTIRDQGRCGSCWAVSVAQAASDRTCIATGKPVELSQEDIISCCPSDQCGNGCGGGFPDAAWEFWYTDGVVSGGEYNSGRGCRPYSIDTQKASYASNSTLTPSCTMSCAAGSGIRYSKDKHFGGGHVYAIPNRESSIQREIYKNGPITMCFEVFDDFVDYKSGVYQPTSKTLLGGHAVKCIGWGEENGVPYWLIANSWGSDWGEQGYFRILRGTDTCGIESDGVHAALARRSGKPKTKISLPQTFSRTQTKQSFRDFLMRFQEMGFGAFG